MKQLPAELDLDALALETKAIQRKRKIDGANLLRLALARGPGGFSLRQSSGWVSLLKITELSNPGVHYRLKQAVAFLAALVERLLAAKTPGASLRWPGRTLRLADGTCVSKPASKGTASVDDDFVIPTSNGGGWHGDRSSFCDFWGETHETCTQRSTPRSRAQWMRRYADATAEPRTQDAAGRAVAAFATRLCRGQLTVPVKLPFGCTFPGARYQILKASDRISR